MKLFAMPTIMLLQITLLPFHKNCMPEPYGDLIKQANQPLLYVGGGAEKKTLSHWLKSKTCNRNFLVWLMLAYTYLATADIGFLFRSPKIIKLVINSQYF